AVAQRQSNRLLTGRFLVRIQAAEQAERPAPCGAFSILNQRIEKEFDSNMVAASSTLAFWQNPTGVFIPNDPLKFLYITDEAEHMMVSWMAHRIFEYQQKYLGTERQFTKMIMITMGALLPGVLLQ